MERATSHNHYRLCVTGVVSERVATALGLRVEPDSGGTVLVGDYVDHAHLIGLINRLHDLRIPFQSVEVFKEAS